MFKGNRQFAFSLESSPIRHVLNCAQRLLSSVASGLSHPFHKLCASASWFASARKTGNGFSHDFFLLFLSVVIHNLTAKTGTAQAVRLAPMNGNFILGETSLLATRKQEMPENPFRNRRTFYRKPQFCPVIFEIILPRRPAYASNREIVRIRDFRRIGAGEFILSETSC